MRRIRVFDGQNSVPLCRRRIGLAKSAGRLGGTARAGGRFAANRRRSQPPRKEESRGSNRTAPAAGGRAFGSECPNGKPVGSGG